MPRKPNTTPSYLLHRPSGLARCRWHGKDFYIGKFNSRESRRKYRALCERFASGTTVEQENQHCPDSLGR